MIPRGIKQAKFLEALDAVRNGVDPATKGLEEPLTEMPEIDLKAIETLQSELRKLTKQFPGTIGKRSTEAQEFDAQACVLVHSHLKLPPRLSASSDFWRWLALTKFKDIVDWRHGAGAEAMDANLGGGSPWDNLLTRLWVRADLVFDKVRHEPYELAKRGGGDFWRSHLIRISYGSCRTLARAFVAFVYPSSGNPRESIMTVRELRELAKRLRRLQATVALELLDHTGANTLLAGELKDIKLQAA